MNKYLFIANKAVKQFAFLIAFILPSLSLGFTHNIPTFASNATNVPDKLIVGFWHNWSGGLGYQNGKSPGIQLKDIDNRYNVVMVSFMKVHSGQNSRIPTFKLDPGLGMTEDQFIEQIKLLQSQGRLVLISLGGADAHIELQKNDLNALSNEIIRLSDHYGFNGLDIDLEQAAIIAGENQYVIPEALKAVKQHYSQQNKNFIISMAPEFPYLRNNGNYIPYIQALEGYYDWISPQFYNQGGDGVYVYGLGYVAQNNAKLKQEFIYYISKAVIDSVEYYPIPHDKLVFGLPSNIDAAANGYIENPNDLIKAFDQLEQEGTPLRGVMTWSINWDVGQSASGKSYNSSFINAYGDYFKTKTAINNSPVIIGADDIILPVNSIFNPMMGVIATDREDGNLTDIIKVTGNYNLNALGDYQLIYTVTDTSNNTTIVKRKLSVVANQPRIIGASDTTVKLGEKFDSLAGIKAINSKGEDITRNVVVRGEVNTDLLVESYKLIYRVADKFDNSTEIVRIVEVIADSNDLVTTNVISNIEIFNADKQYTAGNKVQYKGNIYIAQRWTDIGKAPDAAFSGWKLLVNNT